MIPRRDSARPALAAPGETFIGIPPSQRVLPSSPCWSCRRRSQPGVVAADRLCGVVSNRLTRPAHLAFMVLCDLSEGVLGLEISYSQNDNVVIGEQKPLFRLQHRNQEIMEEVTMKFVKSLVLVAAVAVLAVTGVVYSQAASTSAEAEVTLSRAAQEQPESCTRCCEWLGNRCLIRVPCRFSCP